MTLHYLCRDCGATFPQERAHFRTQIVRSEAWGEVADTRLRMDLCRECGSEWIEPVSVCVECHQRPPLTGSDACGICIARAEAAWDARVAATRASAPKLQRLAGLRELLADIARSVT